MITRKVRTLVEEVGEGLRPDEVINLQFTRCVFLEVCGEAVLMGFWYQWDDGSSESRVCQ